MLLGRQHRRLLNKLTRICFSVEFASWWTHLLLLLASCCLRVLLLFRLRPFDDAMADAADENEQCGKQQWKQMQMAAGEAAHRSSSSSTSRAGRHFHIGWPQQKLRLNKVGK